MKEDVTSHPRFYTPRRSPRLHPPDVICLQETHSTMKCEHDFKYQLQYECFFSHHKANKGGVLTGFRRDLNVTVNGTHTFSTGSQDKLSQCLMVHCVIDGIEMVIVNVYAHASRLVMQGEEFLQKLEENLTWFGCPNIICCGDFNAVMNVQKDSTAKGEFTQKRYTFSKSLQNFIETSELVDSFRVLNPLSCRVTHFQHTEGSGARLDYVFVAGFFLNRLQDAAIGAKTVSDHNEVSIDIETGRNPKGPGYWKFPAPLLENEVFCTQLQEKIKQVVALHKNSSDPDVLWGTVKCTIRNFVASFLKQDGCKDKEIIEEFQEKLAKLHERRDSAPMYSTRQRINSQIIEVTQQWEEFRSKIDAKRLEFNVGRKRRHDEKSSKYFFKKFNAVPGRL